MVGSSSSNIRAWIRIADLGATLLLCVYLMKPRRWQREGRRDRVGNAAAAALSSKSWSSAATAAECKALLAHASVAILPPYARQHRFPQGLCPGHAPATAGGGGPQARSAAPSLDRRHPGHLCPPDRGSARAGSRRPAGPAGAGALSRGRGRALFLASAGQL